jgi:hypothetical protein
MNKSKKKQKYETKIKEFNFKMIYKTLGLNFTVTRAFV